MITVELVGGALDGTIMLIPRIESNIFYGKSASGLAEDVINKLNYRFRNMKTDGLSEVAVYEVGG